MITDDTDIHGGPKGPKLPFLYQVPTNHHIHIPLELGGSKYVGIQLQ